MYRIYNHRHELEINTEIIMKNVSSHGNDFVFYVVKFSLLKIVVCGTRENVVFLFLFRKTRKRSKQLLTTKFEQKQLLGGSSFKQQMLKINQ